VRQNFIYGEIPVNENGTLDLAATIITAKARTTTSTARNITAGNCRPSTVKARCLAAAIPSACSTASALVSAATATAVRRLGRHGFGSDRKRTRIFNDMAIQPMENFGMEFVALWQKDESNATGSSTWTSVGVRPSTPSPTTSSWWANWARTA
jgi:maltoporin